MKNTINKWLKGGIFAAASLAVFAACTDDHFNVVSQGNSDQTLWQNIQNDASLSEFADLMSRITFMKSENDKSSVLKFGELLDQNQSFTLVAPVNGSFDYKAWNDTINKANQLRQNEETERQGRNLMYLASNQFAMNHIARFAHNLEESKTIHLLNGKNVQSVPGLFNDVTMTGECLVGSNGTLYKLQGLNPFAYNLYDYLAADAELSSINDYIKDPAIDTETFSESASVAGAMNENGQMVYIDSVYTRQNKLLDQLFVNLENEDSCYIALIPDNNAWEEANAKLEAIYNYGTSYAYDWDGTAFRNSMARNGKPLKLNADSLRQAAAKEAIITNMFFQPYRMGFESKKNREIVEYMQRADSLITTTGTIFYNAAAVEGERNMHANPALSDAEVIDASNGYVMKLPHYNFDPSYVWVKDISFQPAQRGSYYTAYTSNCTNSNGNTIYLNTSNYNADRELLDENGEVVKDENGNPVHTGIAGDVENGVFQRYEYASNGTAMQIDFRLPQVLSADYKIELVLVPSNISYDYMTEGEEFWENFCLYAEILDDNDVSGGQVKFAYANIDGKTDSNKDGATIIEPMNKVTTLTLFEKFHFDKCYKNVPCPTGETFPRLRLTVPRGGGRNQIKYANLNIVKVICTPYRAGNSAED